MDPQRALKVENALESGIRRWPGYVDHVVRESPPALIQDGNVVRAMPRRKRVHDASSAHVTLPMARKVVFKAGIIRPIGRIFVWIWVCIQFFGGNALDRLRGRATIQRRAARLRYIFEKSGPSFAKLGQQLSLRADILPYAYCAELSKMLDNAKPTPTETAIAIVERSLGLPLREVFGSFDPVPIGAASLATVFQARLRSGELVAVKVRRPGIGKMLAADLRALDWFLIAAEALTLVRPGLTKTFRRDLRTMLLGELNFRAEARYTEMFRVRAAKAEADVTAPKVYFKYCTDQVMVSELVSGVWIWELMAAVDKNDRQFLAALSAQGIEPDAIASKLVRNVHRELLEELFFHADPHPANLVVTREGKICFIDFGAIGRFSTKTRNIWRELHHHLRNLDVERMVRASLRLSEPLPPIDAVGLIQAIEENYTDWVFAHESTDAEWWERSTAQTWLRYINIARDFGVPVSLEVIQFFRATMLYDTIATRLNKDIDFMEEFDAYARGAAKEARRRVQKAFRKRLQGPTNNDYLVLEQVGDSISQFFFQWQRLVEDPAVQFRNIVGKISYAMSLVVRLVLVTVLVAGFAAVAQFIAASWFGRLLSWSDLLAFAASAWWIQVGLVIIGVVLLRQILGRVREPDHKPNSLHR
jgi:ubiquinone biosynthesis protein